MFLIRFLIKNSIANVWFPSYYKHKKCFLPLHFCYKETKVQQEETFIRYYISTS